MACRYPCPPSQYRVRGSRRGRRGEGAQLQGLPAHPRRPHRTLAADHRAALEPRGSAGRSVLHTVLPRRRRTLKGITGPPPRFHAKRGILMQVPYDKTVEWPLHVVWAKPRMLPSLSLNQATRASRVVAMPSTVWSCWEWYSSKTTPLAFSSATSASMSSTSHPAIVCRAVPAYGVL